MLNPKYWIKRNKRLSYLPTPKDKSTGTIPIWVQMFWQLFIGIVVAFLANYLVINYIERYKAEEGIRNLALSELYQPYKERINSCNVKMRQIVKNLSVVHSVNTMASQYLNQILDKGQGSFNFLGNDFTIAFFTGILEQYSAASKDVVGNYVDVESCQRNVKYSGHELATVLNLNLEYQKLVKEYNDSAGVLKPPNSDISVSFRILSNPRLTMSMASAVNDSNEGSSTRGLSAASKFVDELKASTRRSKSELDYYNAQILKFEEFDRKITELFLIDLRRRYLKLPEIKI